ncbi:MAG TPA: TIGR02302 family protein, partial [Roseiarcus sp.]
MKDSDQQAISPANRGRLGALATLAQRVLMVERTWPPVVFALAVVILFLAASWLGVWQFAPRSFRIAGVVLFAVAGGIALAPLARMRRPAPRDILTRLDRDAGASHRPASSLADSLANDDGDPGTQAMWAAHRARLERAVDAIRVAPPSPRMAERDPYAIRFGVALLAFAAAVAAGPETYGRLAAAFDWRSDEAIAAGAASRIDAWIDPPPYAGRPAVVIDFKTAAPQTLNIPEDSILVVHGDPSLVETRIEGAISPSDQKDETPEKTRTEKRWTIHGGGKATILRNGAPAAVAVLAVTPADAPTIVSTEEPRGNISGSLTLAYHVDDRFGLAGARADFARPQDGAGPAPRTLAPPPQAALQLPPTANGAGDAKTTVDLSEHPWAGAKVTMRLSAVSISGKTGQSGPIELTLPQRIFHNPLARALVEQRRNLILDPDNAPKRVETALTGLAIAPELFDTPAKIYLGLKQANVSLHDAKSDADLLDVAAMLWAMAQQIEDGDASQSERDLRAAEQALREALQRGASDQEIRKLMEQLREAARRFMSEMARNSQPDSNAQDQDLQAQDLDKLLDQMEDTARNGSREDAQVMLDQMQEMFENMRSAREGEESPGEREMRKQIGELEMLLHDQQALRDDTFRSDQRDHGRKRPKPRGAPGQDDQQAQPNEDGSNAPDEGDNDADSAKPGQDQADQDGLPLDERQGALRDRLAELQRKLKSLGMKGEKGFDDAQGDMKEAEGDLSGDQPGKDGQNVKGKGGKTGKGAAVDAQGRALEALREGAQGLEKQMQGQGQGQGRNGRGNYVARRGRPGQPPGDDPLGRGAEGDKGR